ncbi:hypothetical protein AB0H71_29025 [Nocardia sp. NPDC050697]|uniref:hypothetical protein n=1 Tax=Nocardia sp. NPDC050697 TaxID=3155158 RepID=UPI003408F668
MNPAPLPAPKRPLSANRRAKAPAADNPTDEATAEQLEKDLLSAADARIKKLEADVARLRQKCADYESDNDKLTLEKHQLERVARDFRIFYQSLTSGPLGRYVAKRTVSRLPSRVGERFE